jgi:hypothetical protein
LIKSPTPLQSLQAALDVTDYPAPEPVIEWVGKNQLAALDVDYHDLPLLTPARETPHFYATAA